MNPSDQPLTRRERRERERAAQQAAAQQNGTAADASAQRPSAPAGSDSATRSHTASELIGAHQSGSAHGRRPLVKPARREGPSFSRTPEQTGPDGLATAPMERLPPAREAAAALDEPSPRRTAQASREGKAPHGTKQKPQREPLGPVRATIRTFGELCITAGLILILFVVWQLWWTDIDANRGNQELAQELTQEWNADADRVPADPDTPFVADPVAENTAFGILYVPRFGDDYFRTLAEGISMEPVLNRMGVGHYPTSAMPGEVGNFAVAGHRVTYGKPLNQIAELRPGDQIVVQTADGFYSYTFRNFDIVLPDEVEVLSPVPGMPEYKGKDRIMTLTACNPMFSAQERYIAYAELTDWSPTEDGPPDSIADSPAYAQNNEEG